jgi:hypothetical protein
MATIVEKKEFDAVVWEVTPESREPVAGTPVDLKIGADVLSLIAVGAMLLGLGVMNTGWITIGTVGVLFPVLVASGIGLVLLTIHAVVGKKLALAGGLGFLAALGFTYVLLGVPTLSALGNADITQALGMTFMVWAIVGAIVALSLLPRHFLMSVVFVITDVALWIVMVSYLSPSTLSVHLAGYLTVIAAGLAFLIGLIRIVWPTSTRWTQGIQRIS